MKTIFNTLFFLLISTTLHGKTNLSDKKNGNPAFEFCLENDDRIQWILKNVLRGYSTFDSEGVGLGYLGMDEIHYGNLYNIDSVHEEFFVDIEFRPNDTSLKKDLEQTTKGEMSWTFIVHPGIKSEEGYCEPLQYKILNGPWKN